LSNRHKGYVRSYEDYLNDLSQFIEQYVRPEAVKPVIFLAHSMGAHIAVRYLHDTPGIIDKAILTSPLIDIAAPEMLKKLMKAVVRIAAHAGLNILYATRATDFDLSKKRFEGNRLTRDRRRFQHMKQMMAENPDVTIGGATFAWIDAMFKSIELVNADGYVEGITVPVLIVSAGADQIVSIKAQQAFHRRMKHGRMVTIPDALHELLIETDAVRSRFWDAFDGFVQEKNGA
jgi:lysophospholipase